MARLLACRAADPPSFLSKQGGRHLQFDEFIQRYGLRLNAAQCRAAQAVDGATLLLAVPGSGKTTVLVTRLGYMIIGLGIDPSSILTMTYTVAATKDMKDRFCSFFGEEWRGAVEFRTINGVCARIIKSFERMTGRRACTACGATYHIKNAPPKTEGICDNCGEQLSIRKDDQPETVKNRLEVYHRETEPLKDFYEARGKLKTVDNQPTIELTTAVIFKTLGI